MFWLGIWLFRYLFVTTYLLTFRFVCWFECLDLFIACLNCLMLIVLFGSFVVYWSVFLMFVIYDACFIIVGFTLFYIDWGFGSLRLVCGWFGIRPLLRLILFCLVIVLFCLVLLLCYLVWWFSWCCFLGVVWLRYRLVLCLWMFWCWLV